ncbi:Sec-independent protein translocase protein TatB [invertebrate metagenome]|uniref:Sec-independent protein translocase protein TatB n=1 Tax=invertebrate metagenome TaxID=1711999 RepID=A0A2H9T4H4_9ZZZZ
MLDIGFTELLLIGLIALVVLGPERLPGAIRQSLYWIGKARRGIRSIKEDLEKEIDTDSIRQKLHNEAVLEQLKKDQGQVRQELKSIEASVVKDLTTAGSDTLDKSVQPLSSVHKD